VLQKKGHSNTRIWAHATALKAIINSILPPRKQQQQQQQQHKQQ
jgi:hypothetical protein